jgi:hydroxypyruvate isomerase
MLRFAASVNLMFNEVPLPERFAAAKAAGFDAVEVQYPYANAANCKMIHVTAGVPPADANPAEIDRILIRNLKAALAASADSGVTLLVETLNHRDFPGYHVVKFTHARRLIEAVADPRLGFQLDLYHRQINDGDLEHALREYIDIARHIQIAGAPGPTPARSTIDTSSR